MKQLLNIIVLSGIALAGDAACMESRDNNAGNNSRSQPSEAVSQVISIMRRVLNTSGNERILLMEELGPQLQSNLNAILSGENVSPMEQIMAQTLLRNIQNARHSAAAANASPNNAAQNEAAQVNPVQNVRHILANTYMGDPMKVWRPLRDEDLGFRETLIEHCQLGEVAEYDGVRNLKISLHDFRALLNSEVAAPENLRETDGETMIIVPEITWEAVRLVHDRNVAPNLQIYACPLSLGMTDLAHWVRDGEHIRYTKGIHIHSEDQAKMLREAGIDAEIRVSSAPEKRCFINFINRTEDDVNALTASGVVLKYTNSFAIIHVFEGEN